jgi:hypothetical protein
MRPVYLPAAKLATLVVVVLASLALAASEASAEPRHGRLGFFPGHLTGRVNADPTQCGVATYCGGPVISNVQIVTVFWTDQVAQATQQWAAAYAATIASSELVDMLSEYSTRGLAGTACSAQTDAGIGYFGPPMPFSTGQTITRGSATQAYTIVPKTLTGSSFDDDGALVGAELVAQIQAGALPAPVYDAQGYPDTLYMVYFPAGFSITSFGEASCTAWDGYHSSAPYAASGCRGQYLPYAVLADCGYEGAQLSDVVSHELAEAITDVDVGPTTPATADYGDGAWYLGPSNPCMDPQCPQNCGEVGDVCESAGDGTIPGTSIVSQDIWSNAQNGCVLNNPGIGPQNGPAPVAACTGGGTESDAGTGGGGVDAGGAEDGGAGSGSSSSGGRGSSGGGSSGSGVEASTPIVEAGGSDDGGSADFGSGGSASGCAVTGERSSSDAAALGVLVGITLALVRRCRPRHQKARSL